jgi:hypothetical protein
MDGISAADRRKTGTKASMEEAYELLRKDEK